jgi:hypothetical protein
MNASRANGRPCWIRRTAGRGSKFVKQISRGTRRKFS